MEEVKPILKRIISEVPASRVLFCRNLLKEYLQIVLLDVIYAHPVYGKLVFYGGSCLAHCYSLPRLSEDLDFVDVAGDIDLKRFSDALLDFINEETDRKATSQVQEFRVYLKFPILRELGISAKSESNLLLLKIEVFRDDGRLQKCPIEIVPLFKTNKSLLVRTFDLPTLMAIKIRAVLERRWERTDKAGNVVATVKGRDYFDLLWYLRKGIVPNLTCLIGVKTMGELKQKLAIAVAKADPASIRIDLDAFIEGEQYVNDVSTNMRDILKREIARLPE